MGQNNQPVHAAAVETPNALEILIQQLEALLTQLKQLMNSTNDDQSFNAAYNEYQLTSARLQVALSLDIDEQTEAMAAAGAALTKAKLQLDTALKTVATATDIVNACTKYLGYADAVLNLAKLAVAA